MRQSTPSRNLNRSSVTGSSKPLGETAHRRIRFRYIFGLSLIACLTIAGQGLIQFQIGSHKGSGDVINIAGRQRMLSQKIAKAALAEDHRELSGAIELWERSHRALTSGDEEWGITGDNPEKIEQRFQRLQPAFDRMLSAAKSMIANPDADNSAAAREILDAESEFLVQMNEIVFAYAEIDTANTRFLGRVEFALGVATLLVLLLEVVFIFEPLVRRLRSNWARLESSEQRFRLAVDGSSDAIFDWDLENSTLYLAPRFAEIVGVRADDLTDSPDELLGRICSQHLTAFSDELAKVIENPEVDLDTEVRVLHADGSDRWILCRAAELRDEDGRAIRVVGSIADITELKRTQISLQELAERDPLTGLANRNYFRDHLELRIARESEQIEPFAVLFFDFDRFKMVNDSLGHSVGDGLLKSFADRICRHLPDDAVVARFGGDEFAVLMSSESSYDILDQARALIKELAEPHQVGKHRIISTASIGIVLSDARYESAEPMLRDADIAMYEAKRTGRSKLVVFDTEMHENVAEQQRLERELGQANVTDQMRLEYQPIVSLENGKVSGFEALARWRHPIEGDISPERFIPIAEECGMINKVGSWVIDSASAQLDDWDRQFPEKRLRMTVNISRKQLISPSFLRDLEGVKSRYPHLVDRLVLEITETAVVDERVDVSEILAEIRDMGFPLAMDDFGTGYSSLSCLHNYPISYLKIDRAFVMNLEERREFSAVFSAIVSLASALDLSVVAEGVETHAQLAQLQAMGCCFAQGFLFAEPMIADNAIDALEDQGSFKSDWLDSEGPSDGMQEAA